MFDRRFFLLLVFLVLCGAALAFRSWNEQAQQGRFTALPAAIPGCPSVPVDDLADWLDQPEAADKRAFLLGRQTFVVSKMSGLASGGAVHDPAFCAVGKGWEIAAAQAVTLPGGVGERLVLRKGEESLVLLFWFEDSGAVFSSYLEFKLRLLGRRLAFWEAQPLPSLFLVQSRATDRQAWQHFEQEVVPWLRLDPAKI